MGGVIPLLVESVRRLDQMLRADRHAQLAVFTEFEIDFDVSAGQFLSPWKTWFLTCPWVQLKKLYLSPLFKSEARNPKSDTIPNNQSLSVRNKKKFKKSGS
jgi:hypothetical protein